ncbi:hypothetical protein PIB30_057905, partial [Stylosanthes scabra]|nr:hypothetical protein [Stylosanthes scabra]
PKIERKSPRKAKKNKESKESGQKAKNKPNPALTARPRPPLLNGEVFVGGVPAPPHFVTPKTRTPRTRAVEVARPRDGSRTH